MAYEGETIRIIARVYDFDGDAIVPQEVSSAVVNLYDGAGNFVFTDTPLVFQDVDEETPEAYWYYDWQGVPMGSWIAQCVFTGAAYEVYEYVTIKVKAPKIVPTGQPH